MQMAHVAFETGASTHVGKVRQRNEDSYLIHPEVGVWAVADGMGGHEDGHFASRAVVEALSSIGIQNTASDLLKVCESRIFEANLRVIDTSRQRNGVVIGTTVTVLLASDGYFASLWCGDSRIYLVRNDEITQLSRDHTEIQELLINGRITAEEAANWSGSNAITRAIGVAEVPELEFTSGPLNSGDIFVICSDGLTRHVADREILECVSVNTSQQACDSLIGKTLERGALDNVTIIVVRYLPRTDRNTTPQTYSAHPEVQT
jgi:protein phosphatase